MPSAAPAGDAPAGNALAARVPRRVWALVGAGIVSYGLSSILVRAAGDVEPLAIAVWRAAFVTLALAPAVLWKVRTELARMPVRTWALVAASGVLLGLHFCAWIASVQLTTVAAASVLVTTSPLWIGLLGALGVGDRPGRRTMWAIGAGTLGAVLIGVSGGGGGPAPPSPLLGNALALGAAVLVSGYYLAGQSVRRGASFLAYFAPVNAVAAITLLVVCGATGTPLGLPPETLAWCFAMAVGPGLVGHGSFAVALGYVPASTLSLLGLAEPVIASALAVVLFAEVPSAVALGGMALVLVSIASVVRGRG